MHHCLSVLSIIVSTDPSGAVGEQCEGLLMPIYDPRADGPICTYGSPFAQICQFRFFRHTHHLLVNKLALSVFIKTYGFAFLLPLFSGVASKCVI